MTALMTHEWEQLQECYLDNYFAGQFQNGLHHLCGAQVMSFNFESIVTDPDVLAGSPTTSRLSGTSPTNKTIGVLLF